MFSDEPESRENLVKVLADAQAQGLIDSDALVMIQGVLEVSEARVRDIMIPRLQMALIDACEPLDVILETMLETSHSRYPVICDKKIIGILLAKDVFRAVVKGELKNKDDLANIYRKPIFVPESKRLNVLLREFRAGRNHLALVVDEYAELAGLVTIEDVLEQIVGNIEDEHDAQEQENIQKRTAHSYSMQAFTPIEEFNRFFKVNLEVDGSETIGGFLASEFGHVPQMGESLELEGFYFKVLKGNERCAELFEVKAVDDAVKTQICTNIEEEKVAS
ncbi:Magnesium and cobalt efflux protein CorC [hydrothermal vent metagenome]|uniref:Magnesium and cobalt efflux protein CorC n=1 Tax=hydrothermal vent metagenome TaxID=652676 RepID=A0A3B0WAC2_9ZZZZ